MAVTLAFDVYGTLLDTHGVIGVLQKYAGDNAQEFSRIWRNKQLEYTFRRALMQNYENFAVCVSQALDYTCAHYKLSLAAQDKQTLIDAFNSLPAFADVVAGLESARQSGCRMYAFSNGSADMVEKLLGHAGIREYFVGVISTDELKSYKPNPAVYSHFLTRAGVTGADAWLISSNPFDVIGAVSAGMRGAWIKRTPDALFDPWGIEPNLTAGTLLNLCEQLDLHYSQATRSAEAGAA